MKHHSYSLLIEVGKCGQCPAHLTSHLLWQQGPSEPLRPSESMVNALVVSVPPEPSCPAPVSLALSSVGSLAVSSPGGICQKWAPTGIQNKARLGCSGPAEGGLTAFL